MTTGAGELDVAVLRVGDRELDTFKEFTVNSHFLTATDGWSFVLGDEQVTADAQAQLVPGKQATLLLNGIVQMNGYVDRLRISGNRSQGTSFQVEGRDRMAPVFDSMMKPSTTFPEKTSLVKVIKDTLAPFGFVAFFADNSANRNAAQGREVVVSASFDDLAKHEIQHDKPQEGGEGVFTFLSRLTQRFGYWMWPTVDGEGVIVGAPDYDQAPSGDLIDKVGQGATARNNILSYDVTWDATDQPSFIEGRGSIPNRSFTQDVIKCRSSNAYAYSSIANIHEEYDIEEETIEIASPPVSQRNLFASLIARPRYVKDTHARTIDELEAFVRREMSLCMRKAFVATFTVDGHAQEGRPWQVDTVVNVDSDRMNIHMPMWVLSRTFHKSRSIGTTTELQCLPLGVIDFGRTKKDHAKKGKKH